MSHKQKIFKNALRNKLTEYHQTNPKENLESH